MLLLPKLTFCKKMENWATGKVYFSNSMKKLNIKISRSLNNNNYQNKEDKSNSALDVNYGFR